MNYFLYFIGVLNVASEGKQFFGNFDSDLKNDRFVVKTLQENSENSDQIIMEYNNGVLENELDKNSTITFYVKTDPILKRSVGFTVFNNLKSHTLNDS